MPVRKTSIISAQVLMRSASGKALNEKTVISAKNVAEFAPSPAAVALVTGEFRSKGFRVGPLIGISFSVMGTIGDFEKYLGTRIQLGKDQAYEFIFKGGIKGHELAAENLPAAIRDYVLTIVFPRRPDFGPTEFRG